MRILVVEDNVDLATQIQSVLQDALFVVDLAHDGSEGHYLGVSETYDAVILDLGLPVMDGYEVLEKWRAAGIDMPVLILSSRHTWREKVAGLRAGADDYLAKPFEVEELQARLEALIRRSSGHAKPVLSGLGGRVLVDTSCARVTLDRRPVELTALEYRTLEYLAQHADRVISKTELTEHIYDIGFDRDSNVMEVLVNRLRNKLGRQVISTRRGLGYQLGGNQNEK